MFLRGRTRRTAALAVALLATVEARGQFLTLQSPNEELGGDFGIAVAGVPDLSGDGQPDIIVGAYLEDVGGTVNAGRVHVFDGATGAWRATLVSPNPINGGLFGLAVAGIADVTADGRGDVIVGAPYDGTAPWVDSGRVYVFSGAATGVVNTPHSSFRSGIPESGGSFGQSVSGLPDFDLDGAPDIVVGAPDEDSGASEAGRVYLCSGDATGQDLPAGILTFSPNAEATGRFGWDVHGIPDLNGDGRGDFIVGAPNEDPGAAPNNAGRAYVFTSTSGTPVLRATLVSPNETSGGSFGASVACIERSGNLANLLVGAYGDGSDGRAYVYAGSSTGTTSTILYALTSPNSLLNGHFGWSVAAGPDIDNDGYGEVVVGAYREAIGANPAESGAAYLFDGASGDLLASHSPPNPEAMGQFGRAVGFVEQAGAVGPCGLIAGAPNEDTDSTTDAGRAYVLASPPVMDGTADAAYGAALAVQNTQTGFGDSSLGVVDFADGSELDVASGFIDTRTQTLYLLLAGNLESNFNKLEVFIESKVGGQNRLRGDNSGVDFGGLNRMGDSGGGDGLTFDAGFAADYWLGFTGGGGSYTFFANFAELHSAGGGPGWFLGSTAAASNGDLTGGDGGQPPAVDAIRATIDNSNTAGVTGGSGAGSGAGVTTGVEIAIPLAAIGDPQAVRVCAFINGAGHDFVSNQVLGPLGGGANLGEPRDVNFAGINGNQFFTIAPPVPAEPAIINEVRIDQPNYGNSGDVDEYFELKGSPFASLDGYWYVVIGDGKPVMSGGVTTGLSGVVEAAIDLSGQSLPVDGLFVAIEDPTWGEDPEWFQSEDPDWITGLNFENSDNVTHLLVRDFSGQVGQDLDLDDDGTLDATPWTSIEDGVAILEGEDPEWLGGDRVYSANTVGPFVGISRTFAPGHVYRDGRRGTGFQMGPFDPTGGDDTPGAENLPALGACCDGGDCTLETRALCEGMSLTWLGAGTTCTPTNSCAGACCTGATCQLESEGDCRLIGGFYRGNGTNCTEHGCATPVLNLKINEIWAADPVYDDLEFIEFYLPLAAASRSREGASRGASTSLAGLSFIVVDGDTFGDADSPGYKRLSFRVDFGPNDAMADGGFATVSTADPCSFAGRAADPRGCTPPIKTIALGSLENHSQTYALVRTQDIEVCADPDDPATPPPGCQNDVDSHRLTDASVAAITANLIDAVATRDVDAGDHVYFGAPVVQDGVFQATQMQRIADGVDTDATADWDAQTPLEPDDPGNASTPGDPNTPGTGACCDGSTCIDGLTRTACEAVPGREYKGNGSTCTPNPCIGACCDDGTCLGEMSEADCATAGGAYMGDGVLCGTVCNLRTVAQAKGLGPNQPVVLNDVVVSSMGDLIGDPDVKCFQVRRGGDAMTVVGLNAEIDAILVGVTTQDTLDLTGTTGHHLGHFQLNGRITPLKRVEHIDDTQGFGSVTVTAAAFADGSATAEGHESKIALVECVAFLDGGTGLFEGNRSYLATDGLDLMRVYVPAGTNLVGTAIPAGQRRLRGIFWQADGTLPTDTPPDNGGYQLRMRAVSDILSAICAGTNGACCFPEGGCGCAQMNGPLCAVAGGDYQGDGVACSPPTLCSGLRLAGDIDGNGVVEPGDMLLFTRAAIDFPVASVHVPRSDLNCDGTVNGIDIQLMVEALVP